MTNNACGISKSSLFCVLNFSCAAQIHINATVFTHNFSTKWTYKWLNHILWRLHIKLVSTKGLFDHFFLWFIQTVMLKMFQDGRCHSKPPILETHSAHSWFFCELSGVRRRPDIFKGVVTEQKCKQLLFVCCYTCCLQTHYTSCRKSSSCGRAHCP